MYPYNKQYNQQAGWNQLQQQQPRLPPGWEAKWDPGSSRWFYINHATKTTQWEAPVANVAQYNRPAPTAVPKLTTTSFIDNNAQNVKTIMSEYEGVTEEYIQSLLRVYMNNVESVRRTLHEKGYRKKSTVVPKQHFVASLKGQYPTASEDVIKEILVSTNNSFQGARASLEAMGYKKTPQSPVKKATLKPASQPVSRPSTAKKATSSTSPSKPAKLSEHTKRQRNEELRKQFPTLDKSLIELSLQGTDYDVKLAAVVLKSSIESVKSKKSYATSSASTSTKYPSSTTETSYSTSTSFAPVIFGAEEEDERKKKSSPVKTTTTFSTTTNASTTSTTKLTPKIETPKYEHLRDYLPAKRVPIIRKTLPASYVSPNRITPSGPDPSLANGPNYSLLQTTRIRPAGPNASNRNGPQPSLRCGPQASNAVGRAHINVGPALRVPQGTAV
ncbi:uncharacterized protein LOC120344918 [Styela clava]